MSVLGPFTAQDFIDEAAELLGIVSPAGMTNAADANSCLRTMNLMLSAWSAEEISARAYVTESFPIASQRQYQWGAGAPDFNSTRPDKVITADLQYTSYGNLIVPMEVIGSNQYQAFGDRLLVTGPAKYAFIDYQMPNAVVNLYPIPDQSYNIIFTSIKDLAGMSNLTTPFTIDSVYYQPIVFNLAMAIAPKFGKKPDAALASMAAKGYNALLKVTSPDMFFTSDFLTRGRGTRGNCDILGGDYA